MDRTGEAQTEKKKKVKKSFFVTVFLNEVQDWAEHSTFHGIPAVFSRHSTYLRKIFWLCVIGSSIFALQYGYRYQINRYLEYKTITKETIRAEDSLVFPAITICSTCIVRNCSDADEMEIKLIKDLYTGVNASTLNQTYDYEFLQNFSLSEMFVKHAVQHEEMFRSCGWGMRFINCSEYVRGYMFPRGYCYTLNWDSDNPLVANSVGPDGGIYLTLFVNQDNFFLADSASAGFKVLIHDQNIDPDMTLATYLSPGFSYFIGISKVENKLMPSPVKALGSRECLDTKAANYKNPLKHFPTYSFTSCVTECLTHHVYNACRCVNPFHKGLLKECDPLETVSCAFPAYFAFYKNSAAIIESCGCPFKCEGTFYEKKLSSAYFPNINFVKQHRHKLHLEHTDMEYIRANYLSVQIFYNTKIVKTYEQILEFPGFDLIASLSGYLGLAIGASVLTFMEFFEIFFVVVSRMLGKR